MPRIRTIKPEFWSSPGVTAMSAPARLTFIGMWNWADDSGKGTYNPRELMGFIFPNDEEMTVADFRLLCAEIRRHVAVRFYDVAGRHYYMIPSWKKHQSRHAKHTGSKLPPPEDGQEIDPANMQVIGTVDESPRDSAESRRNSAACDRESAIGTGEQGNRYLLVKPPVRPSVNHLNASNLDGPKTHRSSPSSGKPTHARPTKMRPAKRSLAPAAGHPSRISSPERDASPRTRICQKNNSSRTPRRGSTAAAGTTNRSRPVPRPGSYRNAKPCQSRPQRWPDN